MNQQERPPDPVELRVTVDTNLLDPSGLRSLSAAVKDLSVDIAIVTVSERESGRPSADFHALQEGAVWDESEWDRSVWSGPIHETLVLDESRLGEAVLGSDQTADLMENILSVIADGTFPKTGDRNDLTVVPRNSRLRADARHEPTVPPRREPHITAVVSGGERNTCR